MKDFVKSFEIRLTSGQAFCNYTSFYAGNLRQTNKNYLDVS
jgi:hypothetical protein